LARVQAYHPSVVKAAQKYTGTATAPEVSAWAKGCADALDGVGHSAMGGQYRDIARNVTAQGYAWFTSAIIADD
jgi:hypothetical protein